MYNVSFRTLIGPSKGCITWTSFKDKEAFDVWNDAKMKEWYQVIEEGISDERAVELSSTPEATSAAQTYYIREMLDVLRSIV